MILKRENKYFAIILFCLLFVACRKKDIEPSDLGLHYSPVEVGSWIAYKVMEVNHDEAVSIHDTTYYELKELVESTFIDNQGRPSVRLERYKRSASSNPWLITDVWYATQTISGLERMEEDVRFLRMSYPVRKDREWNGNIYNQIGEWDYFYEDIEQQRVINNLIFDETTKINQRENFNLVEFEKGVEIYAKHVGMVHKILKDFVIINFDTLHPILGKEIHQTVIAYGSN
jgi:hypothetical protein